MPLRKGPPSAVIQQNMKKLIAEGYSQKQAVAIALQNAKRKK